MIRGPGLLQGSARGRRARRAVRVLLVVGALGLVGGAFLVSCRQVFERRPGVLEAILYSTPPLVRVALVRGSTAKDLVVATSGAYEVTDSQTGRVLARGPRLRLAGVSASGVGLRLGGSTFATSAVRVRSVAGKPFRVSGTAYQGDLLCFRDGEAVTLVNELDVEEYVAGVLAAEMPLRFEDEALKAQVVAARTYVLYEAKTASSPLYDVLATEASQVYRGLVVATRRARRLVRATRGIICTVDGLTFPTYFHSTCGGHTTEVSEVWPSIRLEPLRGVPCGYCKDSPAYQWTVEVPAEEVAQALTGRGLFTGPVTGIAVTRRTASGYAGELQVSGPQGRRRMNAYGFRLALGSRLLKSTNFRVVPTGGGFRFQGRGFGHGVGLCQWGAQGMAQAGWNYREILTHYYPGSQLVRIYP